MLAEKIAKAKTLLEALPYIKRFQGETIVVKYGGAAMIDERLKATVAQDIVLLRYVGLNPVVVHGGGKEISRWLQKVGKETQFIDGLRVTDEETMEVTEMVLSGKVNSEVVTRINQSGGQAVGLSGKDGNLFTAEKISGKKGEDLGAVGRIIDTDVAIVDSLCINGYIPVISCVGVTEEGETLNLNADYVAAGLAAALNALKLIYLTDVDGVMIDSKLVNQLSADEAEELLSHPDVSGGMLPKIECCVRAIRDGVENVHMINGTIDHAVLLEVFTDVGIGTMISNERAGISNEKAGISNEKTGEG